MKCEKSFKRVMVVRWGIRLAGKYRLPAVKRQMRRAMRLPMAQLREGLAELETQLIMGEVV